MENLLKTKEPCHVGADLMAGSLIKNPGGGIGENRWLYCRKKRVV